MHLVWRLMAGSCCAASLVTTHLCAQVAADEPMPAAPAAPAVPPITEQPSSAALPPSGPAGSPESLETPYSDPAPPRTAPTTPSPRPRVGSAAAHPDARPLPPIRDRRKLALLGELGWNGLAGFGAVLTYNAHPHVALDLAGGFSLLGWKTGVRARYNLLKSPMTPFIGAGFNATSGLGELTSNPKQNSSADPESQPFTLNIKASYLVQAVIGFDFIHKHGFTMQGALGYTWLLNKNNVELVDGSLTREEKRAFDIIFKSGLVISLAWGYAFE